MKTNTKLALMTALLSTTMVNAETAQVEPDMSNPTDVYTYIGAGYGSEGFNLKGMFMLSSKDGDSGRKSGVILEAKNIFNEGTKTPKFSGTMPVTMPDGTPAAMPLFNDEASKRSYRMRYGTIDTSNGLGWSIDAVMADHPYFGTMAVAQAGPVMTIPVTDKFYIWPILYAGGVIVEDNMDLLGVSGANMTSSGIEMPSVVMTAMVYARYEISDKWWTLVSTSYTDSLAGKDWDADIADDGLQMANVAGEFTLGYQLTPSKNIRMSYKIDELGTTDDVYWIEYNHAF